MSYAFSTDVPIYLQIMDIFQGDILSGRLARGDQLPSVREVAMEYGVNPNTVQKAFYEMDRMELTKSERTSGRFVIATDELIKSLRAEKSKEALQEFVQKMKSLGIGRDDTLELIEKGWMEE